MLTRCCAKGAQIQMAAKVRITLPALFLELTSRRDQGSSGHVALICRSGLQTDNAHNPDLFSPEWDMGRRARGSDLKPF